MQSTGYIGLIWTEINFPCDC